MTCPWDRDRSLLTFPSPTGTGLVQVACLSPWDKHNLFQWDKHNLSQSAFSHWYKSCLSQWYRFGTGTTLPKLALHQVSGHSLSKTQRCPNWIWKFIIKNHSQFGPKSRLTIDFLLLCCFCYFLVFDLTEVICIVWKRSFNQDAVSSSSQPPAVSSSSPTPAASSSCPPSGQVVSCNSIWWWCLIAFFKVVGHNGYSYWQFCVISDPCV